MEDAKTDIKDFSTQFDLIVADVISNVEHWNKKVKQKEFIINNNDSFDIKQTKIYRYYNTNGSHRLIEIKPNIIDSPELF